MYLQFLIISVIQSVSAGRYASVPSTNLISSQQRQDYEITTSKEHDTHIISFYAVNGPVETKAIRGISSNLIVIYDKELKDSPFPQTDRIKHHYHKQSAAFVEFLEFWPKFFSGLSTAWLKERNKKIGESMVHIMKLLEEIDPKGHEIVIDKMIKDPLLKFNSFKGAFLDEYRLLISNGFKRAFLHEFRFGCKDKIEVIMVFYKAAFDYVYELVRSDFAKMLTHFQRGILQGLPKRVDRKVWNDLFESVPRLMVEPITPEIEKAIAENLNNLRQIARTLSAFINGAMIRKNIDQWSKKGMLKHHHVDIYFNARYPMPLVIDAEEKKFEFVKYDVKQSRNQVMYSNVALYENDGDYDVVLKEFAKYQAPMMNLIKSLTFAKCFYVIFCMFMVVMFVLYLSFE